MFIRPEEVVLINLFTTHRFLDLIMEPCIVTHEKSKCHHFTDTRVIERENASLPIPQGGSWSTQAIVRLDCNHATQVVVDTRMPICRRMVLLSSQILHPLLPYLSQLLPHHIHKVLSGAIPHDYVLHLSLAHSGHWTCSFLILAWQLPRVGDKSDYA
jgi:hypothetical protein